MNSIKTGQYIALKRREHQLTQEQLGEKLGVTNKTISKWETGKCMPDSSLMEPLCTELEITFNELLSGESCDKEKEFLIIEAHMLDAVRQVERLEQEKQGLIGIVLIAIGMALSVLSQEPGGSPVQDFISGLMLGISVGTTLLGVFIVSRAFLRK